MSWLQFDIPLTPRSKKNSRPIYKNKNGKFFLGKEKSLIQYENDATLILKSRRAVLGLREPLQGRLQAKFFFCFKKSCRADGDNLVNMAQDVLISAGIIEDDKLIKDFHCTVIEDTGLPDCTIIQIRPIEPAAAAILNAVSWDSMKKTWAKKQV
jgi:Holliday junction resolvase RusA-like endonuclease